ncbi:MAG TPA: hypothetical protein VJ953_01175 [Saprospiraceae bacterium]|nr:hypothetical protein [Saprospiraceae bacterium]
MEEDQMNLTTALIRRDFALEAKEGLIDEEELQRLLANQIAYMIEHDLEILLSLMYRLDIPEDKVHLALSPLSSEAPNIALAKLVIERQKKRAFTKLKYKPEDLGDGWSWD